MALFYLDSLTQEIHLSPYENYSLVSVFLGAGDWGLVPARYWLKIKTALQGKFKLADNCEVTLECSPASLGTTELENFKSAGVNRFSLNLFEYKQAQLIRVVSNFRKLGLGNFNFDLFFGRPGQRPVLWKKELRKIVNLNPGHLSLYSFGPARERVRLKQELYYQALEFVSQMGYEQYEVCHFCLPGFKSRQNLLYWQRRNYLGFGARAASLWNNTRRKNVDHPRAYTKLINSKRNVLSFKEELDRNDKIQEVIYFSLRQTSGLDLRKLREDFGQDLYKAQKPRLNGLIKNGYMSLAGNRLCLTKEGMLIADDLIAKLFLK